ncbi:unnamed protein product [Arabidopsis arenosa]|uniref:Uncharacterized protein n=1 Tax=Arabidopsis arenosa TaxID=38785 RepID=A0A8S2AY53_ARAAE|nr:unnamed protein product [Arabidopsis arenosa]
MESESDFLRSPITWNQEIQIQKRQLFLANPNLPRSHGFTTVVLKPSNKLLSPPPMAVNSNPRFLSSSSVLVTCGFEVKWHGFSLKPTTKTVKLLVKSRQTDYCEAEIR